MTPLLVRRGLRPFLAACGLLLVVALGGRAEPFAGDRPPPGAPACDDGPRCLEDLRYLSPERLGELFLAADLGTPPLGCARGRLLYVNDQRLPKFKVWVSGLVWRGKRLEPDGYFTNRWVGDIDWVDSTFEIGPSWVDGRPAVLMQYDPDAPLFWHVHDELREIAPGLYLGPVIERYPSPHFRGFVALQLEPCKERRRFGH